MQPTLRQLIGDEVEAVEGYNKAIKTETNKEIIKVLTKIRDEELKHIEELKELLVFGG